LDSRNAVRKLSVRKSEEILERISDSEESLYLGVKLGATGKERIMAGWLGLHGENLFSGGQSMNKSNRI
jgi:hypothetical protein